MEERGLLYLQLKQHISTDRTQVLLEDIAELYCESEVEQKNLKKLRVLEWPASKNPGSKKRRQKREQKKEQKQRIISVLDVLKMLKDAGYDVRVCSIGAPECVVSRKAASPGGTGLLRLLKVVFVGLLCFLGAGISIMGYNNDIDLTRILAQIYQTFTGIKAKSPTFMEAFYSLGLTVGLLLFFQPFKAEDNAQPTPLEVQNCLYERDVTDAYILKEDRKREEGKEDQSL